MLIEKCICGSTEAQLIERHGLHMHSCNACGALWQAVPMNLQQYADWYRTSYHAGVYYHSVEQDCTVAQRRLAAYQLPTGSRLLDVGCGNGAFVYEALRIGIDAWGQDLAIQSDGERVYVGHLADIHFPAGYFDIVTMHDVLEHVPEPRSFLQEVVRVLKPGGKFILDFPHFHSEAGLHHWKEVEHLWMLNLDQLSSLLATEGLAVRLVDQPIPSKLVITAQHVKKSSPVRILVPPGIGDGYWVLTKLEGFVRAHGLYLPEVWVHDNGGPKRAHSMWERVPFIRFGGYAGPPAPSIITRAQQIHRARTKQPLPHEVLAGEWRLASTRAYTTPGYSVQTKVVGFDYFISFNGTLDHGYSIDEALPGPTDWYAPLFRPKRVDYSMEQYVTDWSPYVVVAFWDTGFYKKWLAEFSESMIAHTLKLLADAGKTVVIIGAAWDEKGICPRLARTDPRFVNLVGDTDFDELCGLLSGAEGVFGFPAGSTLLGPYFRKPTLLLYHPHFPIPFWTNTVPPDANYAAVATKTATPHNIVNIFLSLMQREVQVDAA